MRLVAPIDPAWARTIDLDLLLYKDETRDTQFLMIPHHACI
jgi:7,8-dihydro-6-hydroxymethylpterin-pyrophosphokinase